MLTFCLSHKKRTFNEGIVSGLVHPMSSSPRKSTSTSGGAPSWVSRRESWRPYRAGHVAHPDRGTPGPVGAPRRDTRGGGGGGHHAMGSFLTPHDRLDFLPACTGAWRGCREKWQHASMTRHARKCTAQQPLSSMARKRNVALFWSFGTKKIERKWYHHIIELGISKYDRQSSFPCSTEPFLHLHPLCMAYLSRWFIVRVRVVNVSKRSSNYRTIAS